MRTFDSHGRGFVYLLWAETGHYKIGRTKYVGNRFRTLSCELPIDIRYLHSFQVEDMAVAERWLHQRFKKKHVRGEWFALNKSDVKWFMGLTEKDVPVPPGRKTPFTGAKRMGAPRHRIVEEFHDQRGILFNRLECGHLLNEIEDFFHNGFSVSYRFCRKCLAEKGRK